MDDLRIAHRRRRRCRLGSSVCFKAGIGLHHPPGRNRRGAGVVGTHSHGFGAVSAGGGTGCGVRGHGCRGADFSVPRRCGSPRYIDHCYVRHRRLARRGLCAGGFRPLGSRPAARALGRRTRGVPIRLVQTADQFLGVQRRGGGNRRADGLANFWHLAGGQGAGSCRRLAGCHCDFAISSCCRPMDRRRKRWPRRLAAVPRPTCRRVARAGDPLYCRHLDPVDHRDPGRL